MERHEAQEGATAAAGSEVRLRSDYCVFTRGGARFAISTRVAREVLDWRAFTPLPRASDELLGAFNLRGEVVPLMRLDRFLGVPDRPLERSDTFLVLAEGDLTVAAVVDGVATVRHIAPWEIQRSDVAERDRNALVRGTAGKDDQRTAIIDGERLLAAVATHVASGFRRRSTGFARTPVEQGGGAPDLATPAGPPVVGGR
ncbi:MAG TPA: chemotaxis protein CheW [Candidatus Binatia bacterium]|nr:chemotaxis protein CheW [Candidatus Binatia bacterium]